MPKKKSDTPKIEVFTHPCYDEDSGELLSVQIELTSGDMEREVELELHLDKPMITWLADGDGIETDGSFRVLPIMYGYRNMPKKGQLKDRTFGTLMKFLRKEL